MTLGGWRFAPRIIPTLAAVAMLALLLSLGRWQVSRASEKQERQALFDARMQAPVLKLGGPVADDSLLYRRVEATGRFVPEGQVFVDNRSHNGIVGFHVYAPLRLEGSSGVVLVNRGWVARSAAYPQAPVVAVPEGIVTINGLATVPSARFVELSNQAMTGNVWQNLSIARYREHMKMDVMPVAILASPTSAGLAALAEQPDAGVAKHQEYALTWFSLAATVIVLWVALNLKRK